MTSRREESGEAMRSSMLNGRSVERLQRFGVVDADIHIYETPLELARHCAQPWREALEFIAKQPEIYLGTPGFAPYLDPWPHFPPGSPRKLIVENASEMRRDLDALGIETAIIIPDRLLLHAAIRPSEYAVELAAAYNRWLVDEWLADSHRLKGAILAAPQDPRAGAAEVLAYASHPNIRAVFLPTAGVDRLYGNRLYDPIYDAAQEAGLPVIFHAGLNVHPTFPSNVHDFQTRFAAHTISHPMSMMVNLVSLIETGVMVRFPRLKFAFTEAGVSWLPFIMMRLDREYESSRREVPFLRERPSHYVRESMYFSTQPIEEPERMREVAALIETFSLESNLIFSSDWPHADFDHPLRLLDLGLSDEATNAILSENARRLFSLPAFDGSAVP